jgi:hypothetical protein
MEAELRSAVDTVVNARIRAQKPAGHHGEVLDVKFQLDLQLPPAGRARVAAHLAESASMIRSAYSAGQAHRPAGEVVDVAERIAVAVADPSGRASVTFRLDEGQCRKVRKWLDAARERAGDLQGAGEVIGRIQREWDLATGYSARREAAEAARPPRVALESGGWDAA